MNFGVVVIGRNEGERLQRCLRSAPAGTPVIYVDSGSTDGSGQWAREYGADVVELDASAPFTAARARNAGFRRLKEVAPNLLYTQFVDGDCELEKDWPKCAISFLDLHSDVGVVCGRRRERHPDKSIYNWLCDREWQRPTGEVHACGGDAMARITAFEAAGGYRDDLIAGEDPELCVRLRAAGWRVFQLEDPMTFHDAAMTHFGQWWRRVQRSGYAFAQGAYLHGAPPERYRIWESRRAWLWGVWLPLACLIMGLRFEPWGWAAWLIFPLQILRQTMRNRGPLKQRALLALFQLLARFPEACGQIKFLLDRLFGRRARLIEYK
jgi:glycosyltransferase involved in cell wall biosynthesis